MTSLKSLYDFSKMEKNCGVIPFEPGPARADSGPARPVL